MDIFIKCIIYSSKYSVAKRSYDVLPLTMLLSEVKGGAVV